MSKKKNNRNPRKCVSEAQKRAIRRSYAKRAEKEREQVSDRLDKREFPDKFPFWSRLKIGKRRTTLVIDEDMAMDKQKKALVAGYVHREATHTKNDDYEEISPNPDKDDPEPMYLKRPRKLPKRLFEPHNKALDLPEFLRERYDKNNRTGDDDK